LNAATKSGSVRPTENLDGMTAAHSGRELDTGGDGGGIPPGLRQVVWRGPTSQVRARRSPARAASRKSAT